MVYELEWRCLCSAKFKIVGCPCIKLQENKANFYSSIQTADSSCKLWLHGCFSAEYVTPTLHCSKRLYRD